MPDAPASPPAGRLAVPTWLDGRLVLGVLLVLVSVVAGARVLAAADRTQLVWTAARDLAPGTALRPDDLAATEVRLFDTGDRYLAAPDRGFVGYVLERPVQQGELVPRDAVVVPGPAVDLRHVSVPVLPGRYPADLARGQRVDVWATPDPDVAPVGPAPGTRAARLVLRAVPVSAAPDVDSALGGGATDRAAVLLVPPDDVVDLVSAMSTGRVDLVRVPSRPEGERELRTADQVPRGAP